MEGLKLGWFREQLTGHELHSGLSDPEVFGRHSLPLTPDQIDHYCRSTSQQRLRRQDTIATHAGELASQAVGMKLSELYFMIVVTAGLPDDPVKPADSSDHQ